MKLQQHVERLEGCPHRQLEAEVAEKRQAWFEVRYGDLPVGHSFSPRRGYELLLLEYLRLREEEVPVVLETDTEIEWLSVNPCPTLEACVQLGMDTRRVCRAVYEKSTQALLSRLDPELRFHRSYSEIRPFAHHCRERVVRVDFDRMMGLAIEEAMLSRAEGNKGYGAVVVMGGSVVGKAHGTAITSGDPSLHAEVNAIRQAVRTVGDGDLCGAILFSSCEPCPMCSSLAIWANVTSIVYGASIEETALLGRSRIAVGAKEIVDRSPALVEVIGGVLREECLALYS